MASDKNNAQEVSANCKTSKHSTEAKSAHESEGFADVWPPPPLGGNNPVPPAVKGLIPRKAWLDITLGGLVGFAGGLFITFAVTILTVGDRPLMFISEGLMYLLMLGLCYGMKRYKAFSVAFAVAFFVVSVALSTFMASWS